MVIGSDGKRQEDGEEERAVEELIDEDECRVCRLGGLSMWYAVQSLLVTEFVVEDAG